MYRSDLPTHGRAILRRLKKRRKKKKRNSARKKKHFTLLYIINNLYFNQLTYISILTLRLKLQAIRFKISQYQKSFIISNKANCKYVAAKRKFRNNFQNSRTLRSQTRCNLRGELSEYARAHAQTHTLTATCYMHADPS